MLWQEIDGLRVEWTVNLRERNAERNRKSRDSKAAHRARLIDDLESEEEEEDVNGDAEGRSPSRIDLQ